MVRKPAALTMATTSSKHRGSYGKPCSSSTGTPPAGPLCSHATSSTGVLTRRDSVTVFSAVEIELTRFADALAETLNQPQHPRQPAVAIGAQQIPDLRHDGLDERGGFGPQIDHEAVEFFEPL